MQQAAPVSDQKTEVNLVNNAHRVDIPGLAPGTSMYARSWSTSVRFGKSNNTVVVIGAPSAHFALESVQRACIERARYETWLPEMTLAIGAAQIPVFTTQNNVSTGTSGRSFAVSRGAVEGVVPVDNFPGWYQPEHGEVAHTEAKRTVPTVLFDTVRIYLGSNNVGNAEKQEQQYDETKLVPIGASVDAWKSATEGQKSRWFNGDFDPGLVAPRRQMKRIKRHSLWRMHFKRPPLSRLNSQGGMRKHIIFHEDHVANTASGLPAPLL